jgi:hypothetical protein
MHSRKLNNYLLSTICQIFSRPSIQSALGSMSLQYPFIWRQSTAVIELYSSPSCYTDPCYASCYLIFTIINPSLVIRTTWRSSLSYCISVSQNEDENGDMWEHIIRSSTVNVLLICQWEREENKLLFLRLIKMCLNETHSEVHTDNLLSENFHSRLSKTKRHFNVV